MRILDKNETDATPNFLWLDHADWHDNVKIIASFLFFYLFIDLAKAKTEALMGSLKKCLFKQFNFCRKKKINWIPVLKRKWTWACDQLKPTNGQRITLKTRQLNELYTGARYSVMWHWSADIPFWQCSMPEVTLSSRVTTDSCQLTITWLSTIKLNTDCVCLGHQASKCDISHPLT